MSVSASRSIPENLVTRGQTLHGKWKGMDYKVIRLLGKGMSGEVYLVTRGNEQVAMKIGHDANLLAMEMERAKAIADRVQGERLGPLLYEMEDIDLQGEVRPALIMEYVHGVSIDAFIEQRGRSWVALCLWQLLRQLEKLHAAGLCFGDLKPANILVDSATGVPRLIDCGGISEQGQAVKEFTEMYDRAWWGKGTRRADAGYDVFACAMLGLFLLAPVDESRWERLSSQRPQERAAFIFAHFDHRIAAEDRPVGDLLLKVIRGELTDIMAMTQELSNLLALSMDAQQHTIAPPKLRFRTWDVTDWGLFAAILIFVATLLLVYIFSRP